MSLKNVSTKFKAFFLIEFTRQLVDHSKTEYVIALERLKKEEFKRKLIHRKEMAMKSSHLSQPIILKPLIRKQKQTSMIGKTQKRKTFSHPRKLPSTISQIKPIPTQQKIDLGQLNPFLKDPTITTIECQGPNKNIIVKRMRETRKTQLILTKPQIQEIIKRISQIAKIPADEETIRVAVGNLMFSAIMSDVVEPKFTIQKMVYGFR